MKKSIFLFLTLFLICFLNGQVANSLPSSGPVGIGTVSPTSPLTVLGAFNTYATSSLPLVYIIGTDPSGTAPLKDLLKN